jgi:hypothetical protein
MIRMVPLVSFGWHAASMLLFALFALHPAQASDAGGAQLEGAGLVADIDLLERVYTRLHPGLYRYATPALTAKRLQALRTELASGATRAEAFIAFSRFAATVRCGHTQANFYNQSKEVQQALFESGNGRLPFHFRWLSGRMVVVRNGSDEPRLVAGTEVLSIDGVAVRTILQRLLPLARADGSNDGKRIAQMQVLGEDRYEAFDVYLPLLFPRFGERFDLRVRVPGTRAVQRMTVRGLSDAERQAMRISPERDPDAAAWTLQPLRPGIALLRMPDWALYDSRWDWRTDLQQTFAALVRDATGTLIIDLRGNEGGVGVGDELLAHLTQRPLTLTHYRQRVRYRSLPDAFRPYLTTWDASFRDWGDRAVPFDEDYFNLTRWQPADVPETLAPKPPYFSGQVLVLVDAANSSATFEFAQRIKSSGLGTLIGQTTGGNLRGINGSAFFFLRLPNSGIELDLPLVAQFPAEDMPDAGVEPDLAVENTAQDIASGRDAVLAAAIAHAMAKAGSD